MKAYLAILGDWMVLGKLLWGAIGDGFVDPKTLERTIHATFIRFERSSRLNEARPPTCGRHAVGSGNFVGRVVVVVVVEIEMLSFYRHGW